MMRALLCLLLTACAPRLGNVRVELVDEAVVVPIVHPKTDARRWYVHIDPVGGGRQTWFVDTGYSSTTCDDGYAAAAGLDVRGRVRVRGEGSVVRGGRARLPEWRLGGHRVRRLVCTVRDLHSTSSIDDVPEGPIAGVLGADLLSRFHVVFDPADGTMTLSRPRRSQGGDVRLRRESWYSPRMVLALQVSGRRVPMLVDTGANGTLLDGARFGLATHSVRRGVQVRATGDSPVRDLIIYRLQGVHLGPVALPDLFAYDRKRGRRGLLGLDALSHVRMELDARYRWARFEAVEPMTIPLWTKE